MSQTKIQIPEVTLFGVDAHDPEGLLLAAQKSQEHVHFGAVEIITRRLFYGREGYSNFCIKDMHAYIHTSHALMIHPDGYILNPSAWDPAWLSYDYIGALWEFFTDNKKNGNGGFTLRSKKLLNAISNLAAKGIIQKFHPEDHIICRVHRELLEKEYGIVFAPDEVCRKFSIESYGNPHPVYTGQFGFHGYGLDFQMLPPEQRPYEVKHIKLYPAVWKWGASS